MIEHIDCKVVPGYEGFYQVNPKGEVKSISRIIRTKKGVVRRIPGRVLKPKKQGKGYQFVTLSKDGQPKNFYIHRLVASVFVENPENLPFVNHKDGNPMNNNAENLEFVSHRDNVQHGYDTGLNSNKGATHGFAVGVIDNELGMKFDTVKDWAEARGINYNTGRNMLNGYSSSKNIEKTMIIKLNREVNDESKSTK